MNDERIIELFFERSEEAVSALNEKYGRICHTLSYNIVGNNQDAEECVNDAYLGAWNAIPPARPNPLLAFICKIVRNISLKRYEKNTAAKRNSRYDVALEELENCLSSSTEIDSEISENELTKIIEAFLDTLVKENRVIFLRRYWFSDSYADIAKQVGLTEKNVSVRLTRIRKELREYLTEREVLL
ncbi:MAG: sigma-70 family RNA polymerase sigma factor [Ruminococcaceae bacterium]|nr:sigma-70 family RNA polymerase sigma factor [Oscillospiraceae bacterium]